MSGDGALAPRTALVVDDDEFVRGVVAQMLRRSGVGVIHLAGNGREAVESLRSDGAVELIVCDLMMPTSDGLELMHDISLFSADSRLILMSSADARVLRTAREIAEARGLRVLGVLGKPVRLSDLVQLLRRDLAAPVAAPSPVPASTPMAPEELRRALRDREFCIVVQPQICLRSGRIVGAEALVRWHSPTRGTVGPDRFLPQMQAAGLIDELTDKVMAAAIAACGQWRQRGLDTRVAINFAAGTLADRRLPDRIAALSATAGVATSRIVAEVTESGDLDGGADPTEVMTRLRLRAVELSIDDFGTGYSTLDRLQRLPFTEFKIDRRFVANAVNDEQARHIVESNIELAHRLGLHTVAEGVETREDLDLMTRLGCDVAQGYYIARPMPPEQFPDWSADQERKACADLRARCPLADCCKLAQR